MDIEGERVAAEYQAQVDALRVELQQVKDDYETAQRYNLQWRDRAGAYHAEIASLREQVETAYRDGTDNGESNWWLVLDEVTPDDCHQSASRTAAYIRALLAALQGIREVCDDTGGEFWEGSQRELSAKMRALTVAALEGTDHA